MGWDQVSWKNGSLLLREGMEIDLGGIGKEYAVDRCVLIVKDITEKSVLINFGGDLAVSNKREKGRHWSVGRLISRNNSSVNDQAVALFELRAGAIATSGDAHRYLLKDNVRYSHVLNPKTGWPVENAPHTISVAAPTCLEAGMMSTIAMLHGSKANDFLKHQGVEFWTE